MDRSERFSNLFVANYPHVLAYAARRVGAADADDVAAETFSAAFRRMDELPRDERAWLLSIARGVVSNTLRSRQRRAAVTERLESEVVVASQLAEAPTPVESGRTLRALGTLPERDQEILRLVAWDELSLTDVARVLECSKANVAVRLHRARSRFRRALAEEESGPPGAPARQEAALAEPARAVHADREDAALEGLR